MWRRWHRPPSPQRLQAIALHPPVARDLEDLEDRARPLARQLLQQAMAADLHRSQTKRPQAMAADLHRPQSKHRPARRRPCPLTTMALTNHTSPQHQPSRTHRHMEALQLGLAPMLSLLLRLDTGLEPRHEWSTKPPSPQLPPLQLHKPQAMAAPRTHYPASISTEARQAPAMKSRTTRARRLPQTALTDPLHAPPTAALSACRMANGVSVTTAAQFPVLSLRAPPAPMASSPSVTLPHISRSTFVLTRTGSENIPST